MTGRICYNVAIYLPCPTCPDHTSYSVAPEELEDFIRRAWFYGARITRIERYRWDGGQVNPADRWTTLEVRR